MLFNTEYGPKEIGVTDVIVAGWTGRNRAAVQHHIDELAAIGVPPPSSVPLFYRVSSDLLGATSVLDVLGDETSGEVEPLLLHDGEQLWLGLASDHTDRALETHSVAASKQICGKPCAGSLWRWDDVRERLDTFELQSWIKEGGAWVTYQSGTLAEILPLEKLIADAGLSAGTAMLCGTLPAMGGVRPSRHFRASIRDPQRGVEISFAYDLRVLPVVA